MQRPRLKPGEDDLEEMARQFEAEKSRAGSAGSIHPSNVVNMRQNSDKRQVEEGAKPKSSLFAQKRQKKTEEGAAIRFQLPDKPEIEGNCDEEDGDVQLLHDIVERRCFGSVRPPSMQQTSAGQRHFPDVIALPPINRQEENMAKGENKKSLFAKQFQEMKASMGKDSGEGQSRYVDVSLLGGSSRLLSGIGESAQVHEENLARLQDVSEEEVLEEQRKLLASMDPSLVEWVRSMKNKAGVSKSFEPMEEAVAESETFIESQDKTRVTTATPSKVIKSNETAPKPLQEYPGMEIIEEEKLSWTGELPPLTSSSELANLSARFGLDGSLLPHDIDVPVQVNMYNLSTSVFTPRNNRIFLNLTFRPACTTTERSLLGQDTLLPSFSHLPGAPILDR